jgi:site-specific DNA-methyltransferase (adenine-specific)
VGKDWDNGSTAFAVDFWTEVLRVLKPGAHVVAFGGTRSYHRLACAIEDAGFEIRDQLAWVYGTGFPKSLDVSKAIDKSAGAQRKVIGDYAVTREFKGRDLVGDVSHVTRVGITAPSTPAARAWSGFGTALKPAWEPICLARKPLSERTVAANVLRWGTGAINVDACRIGSDGGTSNCGTGPSNCGTGPSNGIFGDGLNGGRGVAVRGLGRWPANLCHDGSPEVVEAFPSPHGAGAAGYAKDREGYESSSYEITGGSVFRIGDSGSAARFFYSAKASKTDRCDSKHPTVKPVALMRWLCRLVTPPGGLILDPFAGTGTTAEAAIRESFRAILIEREPDYCLDIARRMSRLRKSPPPRVPAARKMRGGAWSGRSTETLPGTHHRANRA